MADDAQTQTIRAINWREVFPFTHLFRAFRIAVHPSKLLLALSALLLIYLGGRVLDGAWPDKNKPHGLVELYTYADAMRTRGETRSIRARWRACPQPLAPASSSLSSNMRSGRSTASSATP